MELNDLDKFLRFLCVGTEVSTYKAGGNHLSSEKPVSLVQLLKDGKGEEVIREIVRCSTEVRGVQRESLLLALAMCAKSSDTKIKQTAYKKSVEICKTPSDLFVFLHFTKSLMENTKGWGRSQRTALCEWYNTKNPQSLAELVTKYRSRAGWSHRDVLRLSHIKPTTDGVAAVLKYLIKGLQVAKTEFGKDDATEEVKSVLKYLDAVETVKQSSDEHQVARLIEEFHLTKEHVPTKLLSSKEVWQSLMQGIAVEDLLSNIGKLAGLEVLGPEGTLCSVVVEKLQNENAIKESAIHPVSVLMALRTYQQGKGKQKLAQNETVVAALNQALNSSIKHNVATTNKRFLVAVKVQSSTIMKKSVRGASSLSPTITAALMAMVAARKEQQCDLVHFTAHATPLKLTPQMSLNEISEEIGKKAVPIPFLACDPSAPITWALENKRPVDVFLILSDGKESLGEVSPIDALKQYRMELNVPKAKLIICELTGTSFQFADNIEPGLLEIDGFDSTVPRVIENFVMETL